MSALNIEPKKVFDFFELIASVPHGSDNTAQITELCCEFARQRVLIIAAMSSAMSSYIKMPRAAMKRTRR